MQDVGLSQLKSDLFLSVDSKDVVDWCSSSWYRYVNGVWKLLERDVIVGILGVYLLINNDGGGEGAGSSFLGFALWNPTVKMIAVARRKVLSTRVLATMTMLSFSMKASVNK